MSIPSARWLPLLALALGSCIFVVKDGDVDWDASFFGHGVHGSGVRAEDERVVGDFTAIQLETCASVQVKVGEPTSVHLSGDDNLLPRIVTKVENGVLTVDLPGSCSTSCGLELVIGTPALERFTIEGSGDVKIEGLTNEQVKLAIDGSGTLSARGAVRSLNGSIEGSGSLELGDLTAQEADLSIDGSGSMEVHVHQLLRYSIEGSGDIRYAGEPRVDGEVSGSGNIRRRR